MVVRKDGVNSYDNAVANVITSTTSPPPGMTQYRERNTAGTTGMENWLSLPADGAWQFRALVRVGSAVSGTDLDLRALRSSSDTVNNLIVRIQGTDKLRVVANGGTFPFTSTPTFPHDGNWYRLEGHGNGPSNLARVALFPAGSDTPVTGMLFDDGAGGMAACAQGSVAPTAIRQGQVSNASGYTGTCQWARSEYYSGTDATMAFLGPYNTPPVVPAIANQNKTAGTSFSFTIAPTDDGTIASIAWTVVTAESTASPTLTGASTVTVSGTTPAAGNLTVLQCVVTDDLGLATTIKVELRAMQTGDFTTLDLPGVGGTGGTNVGGATNEGTALSDSSDLTYFETPDFVVSEFERRWRLEPLSSRSTLVLTDRNLLTPSTGGNRKLRLYEGTTMRQEWVIPAHTTVADDSFSASSATIAAISDWGNLWVAEAVTT